MSSENSQEAKVLNVGEFLLEYLRLEGIDILFGLPGAALSDFLNTLRMHCKEFPYVVARQETGAAYIADGYSRVSGKLGVVVVTSGPGATNALTAAMNADSMSSSVLLLTGEVDTSKYGRGAFQSGIDNTLDLKSIYGNSCAYSALFTSPQNFKTLLQQALRDALSIPHRTVHLSLPENLMALPISKNTVVPKSTASYRALPNAAGCDPQK